MKAERAFNNVNEQRVGLNNNKNKTKIITTKTTILKDDS